MPRKALTLAALLAALTLGASDGNAQSYPTRQGRIVVGFPAGSSADILGRIYAQQLSDLLKQQFIVENRPGASGNLAAEQVARAEPDGYTLVVASVANTISANVLSNLKYSMTDDLAPVAAMASAPNVLAVSPSLGASNVSGFIKLAKEKPGEIQYGSPGVGSAPHLAGELFNMMAGTKLMHIPYQGVPQSLTDLLGGRIPAVFGTAPTLAGYAKDGRVTLLAVTSAKRTALLPDVPTLDEAGLKGFDTAIWYGIFAPKGTPLAVRQILADALVKANASPEVGKALFANGADPLSITLDDLGAFVRADLAKWKAVVEAAQIQQR
jgi:tripartite-type tricarboxylate transporter receptor subunit TctC